MTSPLTADSTVTMTKHRLGLSGFERIQNTRTAPGSPGHSKLRKISPDRGTGLTHAVLETLTNKTTPRATVIIRSESPLVIPQIVHTVFCVLL